MENDELCNRPGCGHRKRDHRMDKGSCLIVKTADISFNHRYCSCGRFIGDWEMSLYLAEKE